MPWGMFRKENYSFFPSTKLMKLLRKMYTQSMQTMSSFTRWILQPPLWRDFSWASCWIDECNTLLVAPDYSLEKPIILAVLLHCYTRSLPFPVRCGHLSWLCKTVSLPPVTLMKKWAKRGTAQNSSNFSTSRTIAFSEWEWWWLKRLEILKFTYNKHRNM